MVVKHSTNVSLVSLVPFQGYERHLGPALTPNNLSKIGMRPFVNSDGSVCEVAIPILQVKVKSWKGHTSKPVAGLGVSRCLFGHFTSLAHPPFKLGQHIPHYCDTVLVQTESSWGFDMGLKYAIF